MNEDDPTQRARELIRQWTSKYATDDIMAALDEAGLIVVWRADGGEES